jgi:hypothetical protein
LARRSPPLRFFAGRLIATAAIHNEHNSCAVKLRAYTLDNSHHLASAAQQDVQFLTVQSDGSLFYARRMIRPARRLTPPASSVHPHLEVSAWRILYAPQPSSSQPVAACAPVVEVQSNIG